MYKACNNRSVLLCVLLLLAQICAAQNARIEYIGQNPLRNGKPIADTIPYIDLFAGRSWQLTVLENGKTKQLTVSGDPAALTFQEGFKAHMTASMSLNPTLVHKIFCLGYDVNGSVTVKLNGNTILQTGTFVADKSDTRSRLKQREFTDFIFPDTVAKFDIDYVPAPGGTRIDLGLSTNQYGPAQKTISNKNRDVYESYALGYYYLAFAIIFIIFFVFFKEKRETFYFSLFCLLVGFTFLWSNFKLTLLSDLHNYLFLLSLECLSIFFSLIISKKEKSKWPLLVMACLMAVSYVPFLADLTVPFFGNRVPIFKTVIVPLCFCYSSISALYYLIQGIGHRRWEARAIVVIVSVAVVLFFIFPMVAISVISSAHPELVESRYKYFHYLFNIGICIYPLSAAIVLGRRNGQNQKQLISQLDSIEKLSAENLEKEKEKQQMLENQNMELEQKVAERTAEVHRQKELIEIKNKAITDNINYAQRIQSAILPDIRLIYKALEQSFILFMPKDIVSGDFYAFAERNQRVLIIAGDCTGHGVSGAFMSMIGSSLLNQIINEKGTDDPAAILDQLNIAVIESLKQSENESNDGMDISICSFDLQRNELQYAGANRPLWLVRDGALAVYKPDKFPIGGLQAARNRVFTSHSIQLKKNDTVYIFTDGFADQFGGDQGRKMMTSKFKELLLAMQNKNMREQEHALRAHFEQWKAGIEQVDDVLVIGVRV